MACITVFGKNDHLTADETIEAIDIFGEYLLGKRLYSNIEIEIEFSCMKGFWGRCGIIELHNGRARDFGIEVNRNLCKKNQIKTIAHEMVHIKQFARKEYVELGKDKVKWMNKLVNMDDLEYAKYPWEIEAYAAEKELYKHYLDVIAKV